MLLGVFRVPSLDHRANCCACVPGSRHSLQLRRSNVRSTPKNGCKSYAEAAPENDIVLAKLPSQTLRPQRTSTQYESKRQSN